MWAPATPILMVWANAGVHSMASAKPVTMLFLSPLKFIGSSRIDCAGKSVKHSGGAAVPPRCDLGGVSAAGKYLPKNQIPFVVVVAEKLKIVKTACHKTAKNVNLYDYSGREVSKCQEMRRCAR
ncbi:hypothetical protein DSM19430T_07420 [Desulfovibrio psychrotolerans]|uniref:Uncharacterized protein n=1 Tax=Desulfovibrio psychrotolerans TaxID=415242 RepID=A0A7J0BQX1_9BACT|nr:hypothetical protein DSM19430T_07420 [Desulfovibrio psychrotolerans]